MGKVNFVSGENVLKDPIGIGRSKQTDEDLLRLCLESAAPDLFGGASPIAAIQRSRVELATSYDTHLVGVRLANGSELRVFLKDFSSSLRPKNNPKQRREREVSVYRELLCDAGLGTARYFGSIMDESQGRLWLLLEFVDGTPVGYCELGDGWAPAAEGLGRMHGYFARHVERLRGCNFLIRHDADFFLTTAERALTESAKIAPHLIKRVENLVRGYAPVVAAMTTQPLSLVQGGCRSSNILINVASEPSRVCILDWEEASLGAPLFDVAHLLDGIKPPLLDRLLEAYRKGTATYGMSSPPIEEMKYLVECFRLHMAFNSLSRSVLKGYKEKDVLKLLDYGEGIGRAVYARPSPAAASLSLSSEKNQSAESSGETRPLSAAELGLRLRLESFISKVRGGVVQIKDWKREPSPFAIAGVFPVEVLRLSLEGGEEVLLFVKLMGPEQADHPDKQCRDREPRLYEDLLGGEALPVPKFYGSRWNELTNRREVYLEYVGDWSLKYQDLNNWFPAAQRLAQFHVHFARRPAVLQACDYLLRLDAQYFRQWAERALAVVATQSAELADDLAKVVKGYGDVADRLARQPLTLVHNDLAPKNVLADRSHHPARICFVDWEMAGVGCGLLDLVHLKHGLDPANDQAMCAAYSAELAGTGLLPSNPLELRRLFAGCELHHTFYRLAHSLLWQLPPERVTQWVADASDLARELHEGGNL
jgi:aminoglycoside phosphotransferase (APT) family kinase protein